MSGDWTQYYRRETSSIFSRHSSEWYEYKDKNVTTLPADLPMPPTNSFNYIFQNCKQLQNISALANWDVSNVENMNRMFYYCQQLQDISALSNWNVSNVENMCYMFGDCDRLQNITALANWDVSNVKNMGYMFVNCHQLQDITPLANWNISKVDVRQLMFMNCYQLQDITALANWDVSNRETMYYMFYNCVQLKISDNTISVKSYLCNLPKYSYPKQDHTSLLNYLWKRVKPLLKDTTKLNGYFKRYTIEAPIKVSVKTEPVKETINVPKPNTLTLNLPSDWQSIDIPQWNP